MEQLFAFEAEPFGGHTELDETFEGFDDHESELFDGMELDARDPEFEERDLLKDPGETPWWLMPPREGGRFYVIQPGDFLFKVAKEFLLREGIDPSTEMVFAYARLINDHERNRHLRGKPRKMFPKGKVSFLPGFSCGDRKTRATSRERRCFAVIYVPPVPSSFKREFEAEVGDFETTESECETARDVIHPHIDVHAQYALLRMFKGDPGARADAARMLAAVKTGTLAGIYKEDQRVPALLARRMGSNWWELIPQGEDAALVLDPDPSAPSIIVFRDQVRSLPSRLDPALRKASLGRVIVVPIIAVKQFTDSLGVTLSAGQLRNLQTGKEVALQRQSTAEVQRVLAQAQTLAKQQQRPSARRFRCPCQGEGVCLVSLPLRLCFCVKASLFPPAIFFKICGFLPGLLA